MSKQNSLFLKELSKNYKEYNKHISVSQKSEIPEMLAHEVQEKTLNILANISELITKRHPNHEWKQVENDLSQALSRLARKNEKISLELQKLGIDSVNVPNMNDLLEKLSNTIGEILDKNTNFIADIYRKHSSNSAENLANGNGEGMKEISFAPKYKKLINMLIEQGIDVKNLAITTEKLDENRMRKHPYKIVHILGDNPKTITISDQIGQATYVFDGYISLVDFINAEKWEAINNISPQKVIYREDTFESRLFEAIFGNNIPKMQNIKTKTENISKNTEDSATPDIIRYQSQLLGIIDELKAIGLIENNGKYYFHELENVTKWPKITEKNLINFPNTEFNKKNGIGNKVWVMQNPKELAKLFKVLGFDVANEEEEKELFKNQIREIFPELKVLGLIEINGKYYFHELGWVKSWSKIAGKNLKNFPNAVFNKENGIGNKSWMIVNPKELAKLFKVLGFEIATEEEEMVVKEKYLQMQIPEFAKQLWENISELKKIGLIENNGKYYFHELENVTKWPKITEKNLINFPNTEFNKKNGIGNKVWVMQNPKELAKLFKVLGFDVANEEEEKELFKNQIREIFPELKVLGLIEINGKYYFHELGWVKSWSKIAGKNLKNFPNAVFNKENEIGNKSWMILNTKELSKLFKVLGFDVATEEDEKELFKNQIREIIPELKAIELIENNGKYYFHELKWVDLWPKIAGKNLTNFPNAAFNKENGIGNERWMIQSSKELARLFSMLGFEVATEEEEVIFKKEYIKMQIPEFARQLWDIIPELKSIGLIELNGKYYFHELVNNTKWPKIAGKNLKNFPNAVFNKENGIGNEKWAIQNPKELAKLFKELGFDVEIPE